MLDPSLLLLVYPIGSPFHPKVMNPSRVVPIGGWEQLLSAQGKASLTANQTRRIDFDTSLAGEGE